MVDVHSDDIEDLRRAAELRGNASREHVPRLHRLVMLLLPRLIRKVGPARRGNGVDDGIDVDHPRIGFDFADCLHPGDVHSGQGTLELAFAALCERVHPLEVARGRGEEGDLVDRREEIRPSGAAGDELGGRAAIIGEPLEGIPRRTDRSRPESRNGTGPRSA